MQDAAYLCARDVVHEFVKTPQGQRERSWQNAHARHHYGPVMIRGGPATQAERPLIFLRTLDRPYSSLKVENLQAPRDHFENCLSDKSVTSSHSRLGLLKEIEKGGLSRDQSGPLSTV